MNGAVDNQIEIVVPARTGLAATLRLLAASLGADIGLTVDEIDDLRLALDEVFTSAAEGREDRRVSVTFRPGDHELEVIVFIVGPEPIELDELASTILRSVVDELDTTGGTVTFLKRAAETQV
jgi:serine/threonine-protein kinase RsbW